MTFSQRLVEIGDSPYYRSLEKELNGIESVLDVGCGDNSPLAKVKKNFYSVGIDVFKPSIEKSKKAKIHDRYKIGNLLKLDSFFKPKSFDAVVALDVIEHFEKKDALKLIKAMEKIARKKVIILTPYGFAKQHSYDNNPFQAHKSGWYIDEFKKMGYIIHGMRGVRFIRGGEGCATIKFKPWILWGGISFLSESITYFVPQLACQLLAVRNK